MLKEEGAAVVGMSDLRCDCIPFTGTLQVWCSWSEVEKPWLNCTLHLPTCRDKQWSELFQEPSGPELESQVIPKFLQYGILHSARLPSIKNSPPQSPHGSTGKLEASGPPPSVLTYRPATLTRAERWMSSDASSLHSIFAPKEYLEKSKLQSSLFRQTKGDQRSCVRHVSVWSACLQSAKKCWWELLLSHKCLGLSAWL